MIGPESEIDFTHFFEAAQQQTAGCEQHQSDCDFTNHQHRTQPGMSAALASTAPAFLQCVVHFCAQTGERRSQSTNRAGKDRKSTRLNSSHPSISYAVFCLKK